MTTELGSRDILGEIDEALGTWQALRSRSGFDDCSDRPLEDRLAVKERLARTLQSLAPPGSAHESSVRSALAPLTPLSVSLKRLVETLTALKREHEIRTPAPAMRPPPADPLAGFIEAARHLSGRGWENAAAVIAGCTLEQHLRRLCVKNGCAPAGAGYAGADALNAALARHGVYDEAERGRVAAWLALWEDAVRGRNAGSAVQQAERLPDAVAAFIAKHPA